MTRALILCAAVMPIIAAIVFVIALCRMAALSDQEQRRQMLRELRRAEHQERASRSALSYPADRSDRRLRVVEDDGVVDATARFASRRDGLGAA